MNIVMFTNTYLPHVGGVAESVRRFSEAYQSRGHKVLIIAPRFAGEQHDPCDVLRVPAWEQLLGSDFSLPLPLAAGLHAEVRRFAPDVVHSHHPFLLGDTALRVAAAEDVPIVFTHHTQYDVYTHYFGGNATFLRRLAAEVAVGYANLCSAVIAPSQSTCDRLLAAGVKSQINVVPTGVDTAKFAKGEPQRFRFESQIPPRAFVVGHVGRLAVEKNLQFLAAAMADLVARVRYAYAVVVGNGPLEDLITDTFDRRGVGDRLRMLGATNGTALVDAYSAMDAFAFASQSETQGMVLAEAMAAGVPVVAVDAPGVREIVRDRFNGRLLTHESHDDFVAALQWVAKQTQSARRQLQAAARHTAGDFSIEQTTSQAVALYADLVANHHRGSPLDGPLQDLVRRAAQEYRLWTTVLEAGATAVFGGEEVEYSAK